MKKLLSVRSSAGICFERAGGPCLFVSESPGRHNQNVSTRTDPKNSKRNGPIMRIASPKLPISILISTKKKTDQRNTSAPIGQSNLKPERFVSCSRLTATAVPGSSVTKNRISFSGRSTISRPSLRNPHTICRSKTHSTQDQYSRRELRPLKEIERRKRDVLGTLSFMISKLVDRLSLARGLPIIS